MSQDNRIVPVILSGGAGSRLWPSSTKARPKQFLALAGDRTMLQETALRAAAPDLFAPPLVVGAVAHAPMLAAQLAEVGVSPFALILEPCPRSTAPAIALAALTVRPEQLLLVMPSDHLVDDPEAFRRAVEAGRPLAKQGWLVTLGIHPTHAETGFGYIRRGEQIATGVHRVSRFVEKPDLETARLYLEEGCYDWNGGIFMFTAGRYLDALRTLAPPIHAAAVASMETVRTADPLISPDAQAFAASPSESIDYAVMEKDERVAVVPVQMGWSDIGSWDAVYEMRSRDEQGNVAAGQGRAIDSRNCLIQAEGTRVVTIGVEDLIVIATEDAVLVLPRGQSQRVKEALED